MLGVDHASDGPHGTGAAFDPDHDALVATVVVATGHDPLGEPPGTRRSLHDSTIQSLVVGFVDIIRGAFSFLSSRTQSEERVAQYVIREHHRGRRLAEILEDNYVTNRCTPEQKQRLLDRPDVMHAIGEDLVVEARAQL